MQQLDGIRCRHKTAEIGTSDIVELQVATQSPLLFLRPVDSRRAVSRVLRSSGMEQIPTFRLQAAPCVFIAVTDWSCSQLLGDGTTNGDAKVLEVHSPAMTSKNSAGAKLSQWHSGQRNDGLLATDPV